MNIRAITIFATTVSAFLAITTLGNAQPANNEAGAAIIQPLAISLTNNLNFGVIAPDLVSSGSVKVGFGLDSCLTVTCVDTSAVSNASFRTSGEPNKVVVFTKPADIVLVNNQDANQSMTITNLTGMGSGNHNSWGGTQTLGNNGIANNSMGGTLQIAAGQGAGNYSGSFVMVVEYQ